MSRYRNSPPHGEVNGETERWIDRTEVSLRGRILDLRKHVAPDPRKYLYPFLTVTGEKRAHVTLKGPDTLWFRHPLQPGLRALLYRISAERVM
jgi:hypothetical protein